LFTILVTIGIVNEDEVINIKKGEIIMVVFKYFNNSNKTKKVVNNANVMIEDVLENVVNKIEPYETVVVKSNKKVSIDSRENKIIIR